MSGAECTIWLRVLAEARTLEGFGGSLTKQEGVVGIGGSFKICGCLNKDGSGEGPHICVCMWCVCVCVCERERDRTNSSILENHLAGDTPNCYQWFCEGKRRGLIFLFFSYYASLVLNHTMSIYSCIIHIIFFRKFQMPIVMIHSADIYSWEPGS